MPLRALLYRRPSEPPAISITFEREIYLVRVRRHRQARRYTLRIHSATPRSRAHHAAARQPQAGAGIRAEARRLDRGAARPAAGAGALRAWHRDPVARRRSPHRASARDSAARCGSRATSRASACSASPATSRMSRAGCAIFSSARSKPIWKRPAAARPPALGVTFKRVSIRDPSSRWGSCSTTGVLVLFLAADLRAAFRARLSRGARGRASGRDEPLAAVLARGRAHLPARRPRQGLARRARQPTCIVTACRTSALAPRRFLL